MQLTSPDFLNGGEIPQRFTCQGENINPELHIAGVDNEVNSLVLIVDDPDAPDGTWVHWILWNIPPNTEEILPGTVPPGAVEGITSFERPGYGGPCPPSGVHRYFFKLYGLDEELTLDPGCEAADLETAMNGHIVAETSLLGLYSKEWGREMES